MPKSDALDGPARLAVLAKRHGASAIARRLGTSEGAVRKWLTRAAVPRSPLRAKLFSMYSVPIESWKAPAKPARAPKPVPPPRVVSPPSTSPPDDERDVDPSEEARQTVRDLRVEMRRLAADPTATSKERSTVAAALTGATRLLGKLSGSSDLTPQQVIRSTAFRSVVDTLLEATRAFPDARASIVDALRRREDT